MLRSIWSLAHKQRRGTYGTETEQNNAVTLAVMLIHQMYCSVFMEIGGGEGRGGRSEMH